MRSRGADRPDDETDERNEQTGRSRRLFGRARPEPAEPEEVPQEETGWLDDLRTAKEQRNAIGPGAPVGEAKTSKSGRVAPGPRDARQSGKIDHAANAPSSPAAMPAPVPYAEAGPPAPYAEAGPPAPYAEAGPPAPYAEVGPPAAASPFGRADIVGRPISPPTPAPRSGGPSAADPRSWQAASGEHPSGGWRASQPPDAPTAPGHGRRQIDRGQPGDPSPASPTSAVPLSGNAPAIPPTTPVRPMPVAEPPPRSGGAAPVPRGEYPPAGPDYGPDYGPGARPGVPGFDAEPRPAVREPDPGRVSGSYPGGPGYGSGPRSAPGQSGADYVTGTRPAAGGPASGGRHGGPDLDQPSERQRREAPGYTSGGRRPEPGPGGRPVLPPTGPQHSGEYPQLGRPENGPAVARPGGSSRPVSALPSADGSSFGSRNTGSGPRIRPSLAKPGATSPSAAHPSAAHPSAVHPGVANPGVAYPGAADPDGYRGADAAGRHGAPDGGRRPGPHNPGGSAAGGSAAGRLSAGGAATGGVAFGQTARATASVAPPVVPGRQGVRAPAVPGRAGAMADSPSGVIQRPGGETAGRGVNRGSGRVPRPGGQMRPGAAAEQQGAGRTHHVAGAVAEGRPAQGRPAQGLPPEGPAPVRGTGQVPAPGRVSGRVIGAVSASAVAVPPDLADGPSRALPDVRSAPDDGPGPLRARGTGAVASASVASASVASVSVASVSVASVSVASVSVVGGSSRAVGSPGSTTAGSIVGAIRPAAADDENVDERVGGLRGARSELRKQMRAKRRLRVITLVSLSVLVLGLLPLIFGIRAATRDPVFTSIDALDVPGWAATKVQDQSSGSRWCFLDCRFRERTAQSQQPFAQTGKVYSAALAEAGWHRWKVGGCPDQPIRPEDGIYTCWRRDEFTLDLWVRLPECAVDAVAAQDPAALPSPGANGTVPTTDPKKCVGSTVSIKVQNAVTDTRGRGDDEKPGLTGETPDPVLSNDPLLPTPSPS